jgi:hypothetical protein
MPSSISIQVLNLASTSKSFFCFQHPAIYWNTVPSSPDVFVNCLYAQPLPPSAPPGIWDFSVLAQNYAGVQQQDPVPPMIGVSSGPLPVGQAIELTAPPGQPPANNTTAMTVSPSLGLSVPTSTSGPPVGAFRIVTPYFNATQIVCNAGSALQLGSTIAMSSFIWARTDSNIDCQPSFIFYVQTGFSNAGTVIDFASVSANAAICDAASGYTWFQVSYTPEGTWEIEKG